MELTSGKVDLAVVKDVSVTALTNEEDELEMKLEWTEVERRSRRLLSGDLVEQREEESQTEELRYKKDIRDMRLLSPTPRSPWQK